MTEAYPYFSAHDRTVCCDTDDATLGQQVFDHPQAQREPKYSQTASEITSGGNRCRPERSNDTARVSFEMRLCGATIDFSARVHGAVRNYIGVDITPINSPTFPAGIPTSRKWLSNTKYPQTGKPNDKA